MSFVKSLFGRLDLAVRRTGTLAELMLCLAEMHGGKTFVTEETTLGATRKLTYEQAADQVTSWSVVIRARSAPGVPVVIATPNGIDQFLLCLAVSAAGGLPAPVNSQMTEAEVSHVIQDSGATLVIRDVAELNSGPGSRTAKAVPADSAALVSLPDPGDVAALFYTSGTTGRPKGAELTHRALVGQMSMAAAWPFTLRDDEIVMALPIAHIMGFVSVMGAAIAGIPIYFMQKFSPIRVLQAIEYRRSSAFIGVPSMYRTLDQVGAEGRDLRSIRVWISGADVMPSELARKFKAMGASATLPGLGSIGEALFIEGYGMVEVGGNVATKVSLPMIPLGLGDSLGMSMPGWRLKVVNDDGRKLLPGQVGELMLKGPGVLKGYWGDEAASRSALTDDGWLHTGDLVRSGPFNSVMFQGRAKAVIKSGGYSVYPLEIEETLESHPDVLEAAVVGHPDDKLGEVPVAAVILRGGSPTTGPDLELWAAVRLSQYKAPRRVLIVEDLPRTGTRKVQKERLLPLFKGIVL
ncbi:MAG TPA: class I adenylate-forming enzyme family protein [Microthrixaceae bacterium]|nr:class I adenylate-forming enzyme family protein [Microthrixaceae bacterium]